MTKMLSRKPVPSSTCWYLFSQHPHWVTLQTILKTELWVHFSTISYHLMFVIWNSSFGGARWLANFESQWLFIILIIDLSTLDIIDLKLLFGTKKKISLLFGPLIYNTDFNPLFLFFLCLPFLVHRPSAFCYIWPCTQAQNSIGCLCFLVQSPASLHASHMCLLFSFSHAPTLIGVLIICTWTTTCLLTGPPDPFQLYLSKSLLCLWHFPEEPFPVSSIPITYQVKTSWYLVFLFYYSELIVDSLA